jgi:isoleucyl-tRNA synthetase
VADPVRHQPVFKRWAPILEWREAVSLAIESARQKGEIANPLESRVEIPENWDLSDVQTDLESVFKVTQCARGPELRVTAPLGAKCARCWLIKEDVGVDSAHADLCSRCAGVVSDLAAE